jgi:hypothetical protein
MGRNFVHLSVAFRWVPASVGGLAASAVMAGHSASEDARERAYVPAIHIFCQGEKQDVDARAKRGHDERTVGRCHLSLPGLTRQSIPLCKSFSRRRWMRGSSPRMTPQEQALSVPLRSAQYPSFPPRFRARIDSPLLRSPPNEGSRAPRDVRVQRHPLDVADASKTRVNALMTPHARRLARRLASHDAGRSPLGAPPWRF